MEFIEFDESLLASLSEVFQKSFPLHDLSLASLKRVTTGDPNFISDDLVLAGDGEKVLGAVLGARYRSKPESKVGDETAYLKMICSFPFDRDLMKGLLERMEGRLRKEGARKLVYSNFASWHLFPGVDLRYGDLLSFLSSEGFVKSDQCVDYVVDLSAFKVPERIATMEGSILAEAMCLRLARESEKEWVRNWIQEENGFNWAYETAEAIGGNGSGVWLAMDGDELVAYSVFGSLEHHWFGPIYVKDERRGDGLGSVLLFKALESMKDLGISRALIPWTSHLFFYSQVPGVAGLRHYWMMSKALD